MRGADERTTPVCLESSGATKVMHWVIKGGALGMISRNARHITSSTRTTVDGAADNRGKKHTRTYHKCVLPTESSTLSFQLKEMGDTVELPKENDSKIVETRGTVSSDGAPHGSVRTRNANKYWT